MSYQYIAKLVPLNRKLRLVDAKDGLVVERFDDACFPLERLHPERVAILVDHDDTLEVGRLDQLAVNCGWLIGAFHLDDTPAGQAAEENTRIGTPVSVGFHQELVRDLGDGVNHHVMTHLLEVSLVERNAHGGTVTQRMKLPPKAKPATTGRHLPAVAGDCDPLHPGLIRRPAIGEVLALH